MSSLLISAKWALFCANKTLFTKHADWVCEPLKQNKGVALLEEFLVRGAMLWVSSGTNQTDGGDSDSLGQGGVQAKS